MRRLSGCAGFGRAYTVTRPAAQFQSRKDPGLELDSLIEPQPQVSARWAAGLVAIPSPPRPGEISTRACRIFLVSSTLCHVPYSMVRVGSCNTHMGKHVPADCDRADSDGIVMASHALGDLAT